MSKLLVGLDPGFKGAIAIYEPTTGFLEVSDMPIFPVKAGRNEINHHGVLEILRQYQGSTVWLEQIGPMPGQGVTSMFRFGQGYGAIEMACAAAGMTIRYVTPAKWKRYFGLGKDKGAARSIATQRFPAAAPAFLRVRDDGRAEAALIALYGAEVGP